MKACQLWIENDWSMITLSKTAGLVLAAVLDVAEVDEVMVREEVVVELAGDDEEEPANGFWKLERMQSSF